MDFSELRRVPETVEALGASNLVTMLRWVGGVALACVANLACSHRDPPEPQATTKPSSAPLERHGLTPEARASASMAKWGLPFPPQTPEQETRRIAKLWVWQLPGRLVEDPTPQPICDAFERRERRDAAKDAWLTPLDVRCDPTTNQYVVRSAGPDRRFATADDLVMVEPPGACGGFAGCKPTPEPPYGTAPPLTTSP